MKKDKLDKIKKREEELRGIAWDNFIDNLVKETEFNPVEWLGREEAEEYVRIARKLELI